MTMARISSTSMVRLCFVLTVSAIACERPLPLEPTPRVADQVRAQAREAYEASIPPEILRNLYATYGKRTDGLGVPSSARVSTDVVRARALIENPYGPSGAGTSSAGHTVGVFKDEFDDNTDGGSNPADLYDTMWSQIGAAANTGGSQYFAGGYMWDHRGAHVTAASEGYGDKRGFPYIKTWLRGQTQDNSAEVADIWSNTCDLGRHNTIGGAGQVGAWLSVSNGNYFDPTLYTWGPRNRNFHDECNPNSIRNDQCGDAMSRTPTPAGTPRIKTSSSFDSTCQESACDDPLTLEHEPCEYISGPIATTDWVPSSGPSAGGAFWVCTKYQWYISYDGGSTWYDDGYSYEDCYYDAE